MTREKVKMGRPRGGEEAPTLLTISVRVDAETLKVLERLEGELVGPTRGKRSQVVRTAIHALAGR